MNIEKNNKEIIDQIEKAAFSSGLANVRNCWNKRVKVAPQSISFVMFGETPDANAWQISFEITSLRSTKKINALLEELKSLTSSFKDFDGYDIRFDKERKHLRVIIPDNEKYGA